MRRKVTATIKKVVSLMATEMCLADMCAIRFLVESQSDAKWAPVSDRARAP